MENRLVTFFYAHFASFILLASLGRGSRCIGTGKSILLVFVEATGKKDWIGRKMVHVEEQRLHKIYQFINLFTDVPEITAKVKKEDATWILY